MATEHAPPFLARIVTGPDLREPVPVGGRIIVGRAIDCTLSIDDPAMSPHHVLIDLAADRSRPSSVTSLVGPGGVSVDGQPVVGTEVFDTLVGRRLGLGATTIDVHDARIRRPEGRWSPRASRVRVAPPARRSRTDEDRLVVERPFTPTPAWQPLAVVPPDPLDDVPNPPLTGLVAGAVGALAAVVLAIVMGSARFALFGAVAAVGSAGTWGVTRAGSGRRRRQARRDRRAALARFDDAIGASAAREVAARARRAPGVATAVRTVETAPPDAVSHADDLWVDRIDADRPGVEVVAGMGSVAWRPPVAGSSSPASMAESSADVARVLEQHDRLDSVPIEVMIEPGRCIAVTGRHARGLVRSMLVQVAWRLGPSDLGIVAPSPAAASWRWLDRLPQTVDDLGANGSQGDDRLVVEVVDLGSSQHRAPVGRLDGDDRCRLVVCEEAPEQADVEIHTALDGHLTIRSRAGSTLGVISARLVGLSVDTAERVTSWLAPLHDPDRDDTALPRSCSSVEVHRMAVDPLDPTDPDSIAAGWVEAGDDPPPRASIGISELGVEEIDLESDGPHALVAGTTGSGKSELLRSIVTGLALRSRPDQLAVIGIDFKGGAAFDAIAGLPHLVGVVTDLDGSLAERTLRSLDAELRRRAGRFRAVGASDLHEYRVRRSTVDPSMPRLVIVVDEFATLAAELPSMLTALVDVARRGRSLGLHLILATQRPGGVVDDEVRANTALRLALRVEQASESTDVVGGPEAAGLARDRPGRVVRRIGPDLRRSFQAVGGANPTADRSGTQRPELDVIVEAVADATASLAIDPVDPPWLPPLPSRLESSELAELVGAEDASFGAVDCRGSESVPIGVIDEPDRQRRRALRWVPGSGALSIVGGPRCGATSILLAIAAVAAGSASPDELSVFVLDARRDRRFDALAPLAHCGGVVTPDEVERTRRLLARLAAPTTNRTLVVIDGLDVLRDRVRYGDEPDIDVALRELLSTGRDRGIDVVTTGRVDAFPPGRPADETWVGPGLDLHAMRSVGWRGPALPSDMVGRIGIVSSGCVAQVAAGAPGLAALPLRSAARPGVSPICALPPWIGIDDLDHGAVRDLDADDDADADRHGVSSTAPTDRRTLTIGLSADDLRADGPTLGDGRHFLVTGRPGSGVSSALATIAEAWLRDRPSASVVWWGTDHDAGLLERSDALVVVDDAHRVDDDRLAAIVTGTAAGPTVVAGARADAVRGSYGHWTRLLAAGEHGLALAASGEPPTDVLGVSPPRTSLVEQRPGLGWLVDRGRVVAMQIAVTTEHRSPDAGAAVRCD